MRDENNSLSHHRIHLNWLTNKNTLSLITVTKWSTTTVKSFKQADLPFNSDTLHQWQSVPLYGIKIFPATLGLTCKQLKHTFCKDDWLIPGLRLCNMGEFLFHQGEASTHAAHAHAHTRTHSCTQPTRPPKASVALALTVAALVSPAVCEAAIGVIKWRWQDRTSNFC